MFDFLSPYFKITDFDSPDQKGSGDQMSLTVLRSLVKARHWVQTHWNNRGKKRVVFIISSGVRTPYWNDKVGGEDSSSHLKGFAVDIVFKSYTEAFVIVISLAIHGFKRFGINFKDKFIHADMDPAKLPSVWFYNTGFLSLLGIGKKGQEDV